MTALGWRLVRASLVLVIVAYLGFVAVLYMAQRVVQYPGASFRKVEPVELAIPGSKRLKLKTADGEKLSAWYRAPDKTGQPVVLFLHGNGGGLPRMRGRWRRFEQRGAGVMAVSYRGYPGSSGSPSEAGLIEDARTAFAWLKTRHKPEQIVIHGLSIGTGVATALAAEVKAQALILEAPFSAAVDVAAERYPIVPVHWLMHDQFRSAERIAQIDMPVLIAHGTRDSVIPFRQAEALFARAREPKQFVPMPNSDHNTLVRDGLFPHVWRFLETKARSQPGERASN